MNLAFLEPAIGRPVQPPRAIAQPRPSKIEAAKFTFLDRKHGPEPGRFPSTAHLAKWANIGFAIFIFAGHIL